jgi:hypothetical protein
MATDNAMSECLFFLEQLRKRRIHFTIETTMHDAILVVVAKLSERWEVLFYIDGRVEAERFVADNRVYLEECKELILDNTSNLRPSDATLSNSTRRDEANSDQHQQLSGGKRSARARRAK